MHWTSQVCVYSSFLAPSCLCRWDRSGLVVSLAGSESRAIMTEGINLLPDFLFCFMPVFSFCFPSFFVSCWDFLLSLSQKQIYRLRVWLISSLHLALISKQTILPLWFLDVLQSKRKSELEQNILLWFYKVWGYSNGSCRQVWVYSFIFYWFDPLAKAHNDSLNTWDLLPCWGREVCFKAYRPNNFINLLC